jgi:hypothetical protein
LPSELKIDDKAFRAGLATALREMEHDGADFLDELATHVLGYARSRAPVGATGGIRAGLGMRRGSTDRGPWVEVGVISPPTSREDFYQEYGTAFDRAQPFMRPALASVAAGIKMAGGKARRGGSATSRGVTKRAGLRSAIRSYRRTGSVTTAQARLASRAVSNRYRLRRRR